MKENLERASRGAAELSDDMLGLVAGGADAVDERKQRLLDMIARYEASQDGSGKSKEGTGGAYQDAFQNAMKQGLMNP